MSMIEADAECQNEECEKEDWRVLIDRLDDESECHHCGQMTAIYKVINWGDD